MKKTLVTLGILATLGLAVPARAGADFSLAIGLPGFGLFVGAPVLVPPPVYVAAPPVYYGPPAPVVYCGRPVHYYPTYGHRGPWKRHWKHGGYRRYR